MKVLYSKKNGIPNKLSGVNLPVDADKIDYDNTESELQSTNVQDAIDEVVADKADNEAIEAIVNMYGSKNLLQISATSETVDNVQYTVNSDGSISASGLANGSAVKTIAIFSLPIGTYKINGCGNIEHLYCTLRNNADDSYIANLTDDDYILTVNNSSFVYKIQMQTNSGINVDDTLYPMLRDAHISNTTYIPYAMTNRELTEINVIKTILPTIENVNFELTCGAVYKIGKLVVVQLRYYLNGAITAGTKIASGFPKYDGGVGNTNMVCAPSFDYGNNFYISPTGELYCIINLTVGMNSGMNTAYISNE